MGCIFLGMTQKAESNHIPGISTPFQPPKQFGLQKAWKRWVPANAAMQTYMCTREQR